MAFSSHLIALNHRKPPAFSLVEILVCVGVLALLITVTVGASRQFIQRAQASQCISNLRQLHAGLMLLAAEQNQRISSLSGGSGVSVWGTKLRQGNGTLQNPQGFVTDGRVFRCPSLAVPQDYALDKGSWAWATYGLNMFSSEVESIQVTNAGGTAIGGESAIVIPRVTHPARFVLLADSWAVPTQTQSFRLLKEPSCGIHLRHQNHANLLFLDGHIEAADYDRSTELGIPHIYGVNGTRLTASP